MKCIRNTLSVLVSLIAFYAHAQLVKGTLKDDRDGKKYRTISIDGKTWMLENLNYEISPSYCFQDNPRNCSQHGRLYPWILVKEQKLCPKGWHIPSRAEWESLYKSLNAIRKKGELLTKLFNLHYGGLRYDIGKYVEEGRMEIFWTSTPKKEGWAFAAYFLPNYVRLQFYEYQTENAMYCRCVKD